jgi:hypothetical protein
MRWVDLGTIPVDHAPPTTADTAAMISVCMAITASWRDRVLSFRWLPRPGDDGRAHSAIRQWLVGLVGLAENTQLQFVAVGSHGGERMVGTAQGVRNIAAHITTAHNETLEIRSNQDENPAPEIVAQRWIAPIASLRLRTPPSAIAPAAGLLGMRGADGTTSLIEFDTLGALRIVPLGSLARLPDGGNTLIGELDRVGRHGHQLWHSMAQLDAHTIGVVHAGHLVVGSAGPLQNVLTS